MASANITALTNLATPTPTMLMYAALSPFGVTDDRKITANALLSTITAGITDKSVQWDDGLGTATVSAAGKGKIRYNDTTKTFQYSADGAAYAEFGGIPGAPANSVQYNNAGAFGGSSGFLFTPAASPNVQITAQAGNHIALTLIGGAATPTVPLFVAQNPAGTTKFEVDSTTSGGGITTTLERLSYVRPGTSGLGIWANADGGGFESRVILYSGAAQTVFSELLTVGGGAANADLLSIDNSAVLRASDAAAGGLIIVNGHATSPVIFGTGGSATANERMRILSTGLVGINQTTPTAQIHVVSGANNRIAALINSAAVPSVDIFQVQLNGTNVLQVDSGGNTIITGKLTVTGAIDPTSLRLSGGTDLYFESANGNSAAVSAANEGRIRYNVTTQTWQASMNGAAYVDFATGSAGLVVGTTPIASGAAGRLLYETSGNVLGEVAGSSATSDGALTLAATARTSGNAPYLRIQAPADTNQTANTEFPGIVLGGNASGATVTRTGADGTSYARQAEVIIPRPTYAYAGSTTIDVVATLRIDGDPIFGANANPNAWGALVIDNGGKILFGGTSNDVDVGLVRRTTNTLRVTTPLGGAGQLLLGSSIDGPAGQLTVVSAGTSTVSTHLFSASGSSVAVAQLSFDSASGSSATASTIMTFNHNSAGAAAAGFGTRINYLLESGSGSGQQAGALDLIFSTITAAAETSAFIFNTRTGGAAQAEVARIGGATDFLITGIVRTSGSPTHIRFVTPADTTLAADTESIFGQFGGDSSAATVTRQFTAGGGAFATQRENVFIAPTYAMTSADTITTCFTLAVSAAPIAGTNATLTNPYAFGVQSGESFFAGMVKVGGTTTLPTRQLQITGANTSRVSLYAESAAASTVDLAQFVNVVDDTATVANLATFTTNSDGTAAAGFGASFTFNLESDTTASQSAWALQWLWRDAADSTRSADVIFQNVNNGSLAEAFRITSDGYYLYNGQKRVSTQFDKTNDTLENITGLSVNVRAGRKYYFEAVLYTASDVSAGVKFAIGGTTVIAALIYEAVVNQGGVDVATGTQRATALGTAVGQVTAVTTAYCRITGTISVDTGGTLTVQFAQNVDTATSSVLVGSTFIVNEIA